METTTKYYKQQTLTTTKNTNNNNNNKNNNNKTEEKKQEQAQQQEQEEHSRHKHLQNLNELDFCNHFFQIVNEWRSTSSKTVRNDTVKLIRTCGT